MNRLVRLVFILILTATVLAAATAMAQSNGTVKGVLKDQSGAVLPGANVTLTNKATQRSISTTTNGSGMYTFEFLPPGEYSLIIEMAGFSRLVRENVTVNLAETVVNDATLQVGGVNSEITVTDVTPTIQTTTSDLGRVVENVMVTEVPLSSRNFTQILALSPGVSADVANAGNLGRNSINVSANGSRPYANSVTFNGMLADNVVSLGFDDAADKPGIPIPAPDAILEFKVQTGLYDAEYGRQGGANVNLITKSGSNSIHGTAFEFVRNDDLNANEFFRNETGESKPVLKQNQFGGTMGGPIVKDRLFWFFSYQGTRQRNGVSSASAVNTFLPVLGNRTAQTLGALYAGQRGAQTPTQGVAIAADGSNINPVALKLLNAKLPDGSYAIPDPQITLSPTTGFSAFSIPAVFTEDQAVLNLDQVTKSGEHRAFKFFWALLPQTLPFSAGNVPGFGEKDRRVNLNFALSDTRSFGPRMVNDFRLGYNRMYVRQQPFEPLSAAQIGMPSPFPQYQGMALFSVTGMFSLGPNTNNDSEMLIHNMEGSDTISWNKGKHDIRLGGNVTPHRVNWSDVFLTRGMLDFLSFPDFLLGLSGAQNGTPFSNISVAGLNNGIFRSHPRYNDFALFVQDDFRYSERLTFNLGLRYQYNGWQWDARGRNSGFDRAIADYGPIPAGGTFAGFEVPSNANITVPPTFTKLDRKTMIKNENWLGFSPRFGFAFRPIASNTNFVLRGGFGIFWSALAGTSTMQGWFDPWAVYQITGGTANSQASLQNPWIQGIPQANQFPIFIPITMGSNRSILYQDPNTKEAYTQQWSLNMQYGLHTYALEIGYVGSRSLHLGGTLFPEQALLASPNNPIHDQTTSTLENINSRVPILGFSPQALQEYNTRGDGDYNSMQLSLRKRYANRLTFTSSYTLGHSIDDVCSGTPGRNAPLCYFTGDFYNLKSNKGSSTFDRRQRFVASYVFDLPGIGHNAFTRGMLNGWSLSGVTTIQTGLPFDVTDASAGTIYGGNSYAQFAPGKGASDAALTGRTQNRLNEYFNTSVFVTAPTVGDGTGWGNAGRAILRGPGQMNWDMALLKAFKVGSRENSNLEFRTEFFNIFNHPQFGLPSSEFTSKASFGAISTTVVAPRIIQFALKYAF